MFTKHMPDHRLARPRSPAEARALVFALALSGIFAGIASADITLFDGTFADSDWTEEVIQNPNDAWTHTVAQQPTGGNPDSYRGQDWSINATTGAQLITFNGFSGGIYDPSVSGTLATVSYSYDTIVRRPDNSAGVVFVNPALKQGDSIYVTSYTSFLANSASWQHADRLNIPATTFVKVSGTGPAKPNFTTTGSPITFGYNPVLTANVYSVHHGLDNFQVVGGTITTGQFTVNVDLGDRLAYTGPGVLPTAGTTWNVRNGSATPVNALKSSEDTATSVGYRWTPYTNAHTFAPVNAWGDYLDGDRPALNSDAGINGVAADPTPDKFGGEMFLTGLVANSKHDLALYGSLYGEVGDRVHTTTFTVNGKALSTTSLFDGEGLNYVVFNDVPADANGEIFIKLRNASANSDGRSNGGYWVINGFQLESLGLANPTYASNASGDFASVDNWTGGVPTGAGAVAEFKGNDAASITVSLSAPQTLGTVGFDGNRQYTIAGSGLTLDGGDGYRGVVNVTGGSHEIASSLTFGQAGGEIVLGQNARLKLSGAVTGTVKRLSIATGATLDLATGSSLIVDYDLFSNFNAVNALVSSGRAAGGTGITSSSVEANSQLAALVVESSALLGSEGGTFRGQAVDATALIVGVFLKGDSDLSGTVGFDDLLKLAQNYGQSADQTWLTGDFDFSGGVDFSDLLSLAQNYSQSFVATGVELTAMGLGAHFQNDWAMAQSLVPEPASLLFTGAIATLGVGRRRR